MDLQLAGKVALVTGASIGIGRTIARVLAEEGCRLAILARRAQLLEAVADEIAGDIADDIADRGGERPMVIVEDVTADGMDERVRSRVMETFF